MSETTKPTNESKNEEPPLKKHKQNSDDLVCLLCDIYFYIITFVVVLFYVEKSRNIEHGCGYERIWD